MFKSVDVNGHFKLYFTRLEDGQEIQRRDQLELDRFLDPRWIAFGTTPEAFQKSEAIQGDPAGSRVDRVLDRFLDRPLDRRWIAHSDLHDYAQDDIKPTTVKVADGLDNIYIRFTVNRRCPSSQSAGAHRTGRFPFLRKS